MVPVFGTFAPFFQRTYDQVSHDLCLNNNPATLLLLSAGAYGMNSDTHIALCDIQMFAHIPNLIYLAPSTKEEYKNMLKYATTQKNHPVGIRVPAVWSDIKDNDNTDYSLLKNKVISKGTKVAIFGVGKMIDMAIKVRDKIKETNNLDITIINPLILSNLDTELLDELKTNHNLIITLEDGELMSGYGQTIASYYGTENIKVKNFGISKKFHTDFDAEELLKENGMSVENLTTLIKENI